MKTVLTILAVLVCLATDCFADWNTYHGGSALAGYANIDFPKKPKQLWRFKADSEVVLSPVTGGDMIFFISGKGTLYALSSAGVQKWLRLAAKDEDFVGAPVYVNGMVAVISDEGVIYVFDAKTGIEKWKHTIKDERVESAPNYQKVGDKYQLIVMASQDGRIYCFDLEKGTLLRKFEETARTDGSPVVGDGRIMFGNCDSELHIFSGTTGKKEGSVPLGENGQVATGAATRGSLVFVGTYGGKLVCVDTVGRKVKWSNSDNEGALLTTSAVNEDNVVFASDYGTVYCADVKKGQTKWSFDTKGTPTGTAIVKDKTVVVSDGKIFLLNLKDGTLLWSKEVGDEASSPAFVADMLIIGSDDDYVTAFGKGDKKP